MEVRVPKEVAEALDYHKSLGIPSESLSLFFMSIPFSIVHGYAAVLKEYASEHPTNYLKAITNGYVPVRNTQEELAKMINDWLDEPYEGSEQKDIQDFAKRVTNFFQQQT